MKMNKAVAAFGFLLLACSTQAQTYEPTPANIQARQDFRNRQYGMFIHWGVYSLLGDGEWVMNNQKIPYEKYSLLPNAFYPHNFNAKEWVGIAKNAGMRYITVTSRHHDGFSMFATKASPYNIVDASPFKKDPLKELAAECRAQGIKLFFYYSLLDWGRNDYGYGKKIVNGAPENTDWRSYINFMKQQLEELLTNYPDIGGIWFDGEWERTGADWHLKEIYDHIHRIKPDALIGNNHHVDPHPGEDFQMFERDLPGENTAGWHKGAVSALPLETCETINGSWGFNINDKKYKTTTQVIHYLVNAAGRNANLLLNVGPMPDGRIQQEFADTLQKAGVFIQQYAHTIYGTKQGFCKPQPWGVTTSKGNTHFIHLLKTPAADVLFIPGVTVRFKSAVRADTKQPVQFKQMPEGVLIYLTGLDKNAVDNIIEVTVQP